MGSGPEVHVKRTHIESGAVEENEIHSDDVLVLHGSEMYVASSVRYGTGTVVITIKRGDS